MTKIVLVIALAIFYTQVDCSVALAFGNKDFRPSPPPAQASRPAILDDVGITEHLGESIDLTLPFRDESGATVPLQNFFKDGKPVLLALVYYSCPSLCNLLLNSMTETLQNIEWTTGNQFHLVAVSINPDETPELAKDKRESYLKQYGRYQSQDGWHFLTGTEESINKLAGEIGFNFKKDEKTGEYAHAAASYVLTPAGKISYYHYGLKIDPKYLRLSLVEASENHIGTVMDRALLFCMQYDPSKKRYAFYAINIMRVAGGLLILFLLFFLGRFWLKQKNSEVT